MTLAAFFLVANPAEAQLTDSRVIEWSCPLIGEEAPPTPPPDPAPGALVADGQFVWYVTRLGQQRLVRFRPGSPLDSANATCNWWDLQTGTVTTGGLRFRPLGTTAYIRTLTNLQRIETTTNARTVWNDGLESSSDVAVTRAGSTNYVYTTGVALPSAGEPEVLQRFAVGSNGSATITRWPVGGGAGVLYLSGVDVHPSRSNIVYYAEPFTNVIGQVTINGNNTATIKRFHLNGADPSVMDPRQLDVSPGGLVYGVTASGHTFQLNPTSNEVLIGLAPFGPGGGNTGVDASGLIGYTASLANRVGAWFPEGTPVAVPVTTETVSPQVFPLTAPTETIPQYSGPAKPVVKLAPATELPSPNGNGTFYETQIDLGLVQNPENCETVTPNPEPDLPSDTCEQSTEPLGIAADPNGGPGAFYAAIGRSILKIAHVDVPVPAAGMVAGGGWIQTEAIADHDDDPLTPPTAVASKGTFGMIAMRRSPTDPVKGHVTYINHANDGKVISLELTNLVLSGNQATVEGVCKNNTDCVDFRVHTSDNGQPNSTTPDTFEIQRDPLLGFGVGAADGGPLQGGNVKVFKNRQ